MLDDNLSQNEALEAPSAELETQLLEMSDKVDDSESRSDALVSQLSGKTQEPESVGSV
jgi:hypothetical protein